MRRFPPARTSALPQREAGNLALLATPFLRQAPMRKSIYVPARLETVISPHDITVLEYVSALRASVRSTVLAERRRGVPLAEIVGHVQEIVRLKEESMYPAAESLSLAFRAISKSAVSWCIDAYLPSTPDRSRDCFALQSPS